MSKRQEGDQRLTALDNVQEREMEREGEKEL